MVGGLLAGGVCKWESVLLICVCLQYGWHSVLRDTDLG